MSFLLLKLYFLVTSIYLKVTRTWEKHISLLNLVHKICTYAAYFLVSKVKPQLPQFINTYSTSTNHFLITLNNLNIEKELFSNSFVAYFTKQFALGHINWLGFPLTFFSSVSFVSWPHSIILHMGFFMNMQWLVASSLYASNPHSRKSVWCFQLRSYKYASVCTMHFLEYAVP